MEIWTPRNVVLQFLDTAARAKGKIVIVDASGERMEGVVEVADESGICFVRDGHADLQIFMPISGIARIEYFSPEKEDRVG